MTVWLGGQKGYDEHICVSVHKVVHRSSVEHRNRHDGSPRAAISDVDLYPLTSTQDTYESKTTRTTEPTFNWC